MITRDHDRADAGALGQRDSVLRFVARRVDHSDQPEEDEIVLDALVNLVAPERVLRQRSEGDTERSQRFSRQVFIATRNLRAAFGRERSRLFADKLLRAAHEQDIRRAFGQDEQAFLPLGVAVNRAHELALGGEGHFADADEPGGEALRPRARALRAATIKRALGRVALHDPASVALLQRCIVGPVGRGERTQELEPERAVDRSSTVAPNVAFGCVARAAQSDAPACGDNATDRHFVLGERAGLVGGDDIRRSERFDRREMADDGIPFRHALYAEREDGGDHRRQAFRNGRNRERDAQDEHVEDGRESAHVLDKKNGRDHHDGDDDDERPEHLADAVELPLQRRDLVRRVLQQPGDAAHFGLHPRRRDDRATAPIGRRRAAEDHVVPVAERHLLGDRGGVLRHRQALACQRRLRRLQRGGLN